MQVICKNQVSLLNFLPYFGSAEQKELEVFIGESGFDSMRDIEINICVFNTYLSSYYFTG